MVRKQPTQAGTAVVEQATDGEVAVVTISGLVDEHFRGLGTFDDTTKYLAINTAGITRMTSFGVRQWLRGLELLPKTIHGIFLLDCPTFFVDQLNMVLNFGGSSQVVTFSAPFACTSCGTESAEKVDVLAERALLAKRGVPERLCSQCGTVLELDETPESYFSFVDKYGASHLPPPVARTLAARGLYTGAADVQADKPPRVIKLMRGEVTYFRVIGSIGSTFRARPFLVGAEGEVIIDLADLEAFDPAGYREWRRLLKSLSSQVKAITLVDVTESLLAHAADTLTLAPNIATWSVLVPYLCHECGRGSRRSERLTGRPVARSGKVCPTCGGDSWPTVAGEALAPLSALRTTAPEASAKLVVQRDEVLSRELADEHAARALEGADASFGDGSVIDGKYEIVRPLSAGGMAEVFIAKQRGIGGFEKPVALKRIQRQLLEKRQLAVDLFLNEAKIAGRLMHPNIVQVFDVGEVGGALYLAMEYVHGTDLRDLHKELRARRLKMPIAIACYIVREIAMALHHAYWSKDMAGKQLTVVHRDVSPHNVILGFDGVVKLLDFGVALSAVTEQGESMIVGKWQYMSPEHTANQQLDHRSDLFSLGVILFLLCTRSMPFVGSDVREIVWKIRAGQLSNEALIAAALPDDLEQLIRRMLDPDPDNRPATGHDVVTALSKIARDHHLECSAAQLSSYLGEMYGTQATRVVELVRGAGSGSASDATRIDATPSHAREYRRDSVTPLPISPDSGSKSAVRPDQSVSLIRSAPPHVRAASLAARARRTDLPWRAWSILLAAVILGYFVISRL